MTAKIPTTNPAPDAVRFAIVKISKLLEPLDDDQRDRVKAVIDGMFPSVAK